MVRLSPSNQFPSTKENLKQILLNYGLQEFSYKELTGGIVNMSFIIVTKDKKYVLRVYQYARKSTKNIEEEIIFQQYLAQHDIPVAHIFPTKSGENVCKVFADGREWQALLMEFKEGAAGGQYSDILLEELATVQAKMHLLGITFAKDRIHLNALHILENEHAQRALHMAHQIDANREFLARASGFQLLLPKTIPYGLNHLDIDLEGNVLVKNNHITAIVDFDDVQYSPSVVCLGYTLWHILFDTKDEEKVKQYLAVYERIRPLSQEEIRLLPFILQFRNFATGALAIELKLSKSRLTRIREMEKEIPHVVSILEK